MDSPRLRYGVKAIERLKAKHFPASKATRPSPDSQQSSSGNRARQASAATPPAAVMSYQNAARKIPSSAPAKVPLGSLAAGGSRLEFDDDWRPHEEDDQDHDDNEDEDEEDDAFQTQNADHILQLRERHQAENNKENRAGSSSGQVRRAWTDRQPGAHRVQWGDSQELSQDIGFQQPHHRQPLQPLPSRKRGAPESLVSNDHSPRRKRPRFGARTINDEDDEVRAPRTVSKPSQAYNLANAAARQMTALQPKVPQVRRPWSEAEIVTLVELIGTFGCSWAVLKAEDNDHVLQNRDQVGLKDKARNMKFDFLK